MIPTWALVILMTTHMPRSESLVIPGFASEAMCQDAARVIMKDLESVRVPATWAWRWHWCIQVTP